MPDPGGGIPSQALENLAEIENVVESATACGRLDRKTSVDNQRLCIADPHTIDESFHGKAGAGFEQRAEIHGIEPYDRGKVRDMQGPGIVADNVVYRLFDPRILYA